jgi:hypothetical protein
MSRDTLFYRNVFVNFNDVMIHHQECGFDDKYAHIFFTFVIYIIRDSKSKSL